MFSNKNINIKRIKIPKEKRLYGYSEFQMNNRNIKIRLKTMYHPNGFIVDVIRNEEQKQFIRNNKILKTKNGSEIVKRGKKLYLKTKNNEVWIIYLDFESRGDLNV